MCVCVCVDWLERPMSSVLLGCSLSYLNLRQDLSLKLKVTAPARLAASKPQNPSFPPPLHCTLSLRSQCWDYRYVLLHPVFSSSVRDSTSAPHALQQQIIYCRSHHPSLHISKISKQNQEMKTAIFGVRLSSNTQSSNTGVVYDSQVTSCTCKQRENSTSHLPEG